MSWPKPVALRHKKNVGVNFFLLYYEYRNAASRGDNSDFIPVKGDVEMDLDINEEMKRDQEETIKNSMNS